MTQKTINWFWSLVEKSEGCWVWSGTKDKEGYGVFRYTADGERLFYLAHRLSWELSNNRYPGTLKVRHTCDNPPCVNPEHLIIGTQIDNVQDMKDRGRAARGEAIYVGTLTEVEVKVIREMHDTGKYTHRELGSQFGVSHNTIGHIVRRQTWGHV